MCAKEAFYVALNNKNKKIYAKVMNIEQEKRIVYLKAILDYMEINHINDTFVVDLYSYMLEYGSHQYIIREFINKYPNLN